MKPNASAGKRRARLQSGAASGTAPAIASAATAPDVIRLEGSTAIDWTPWLIIALGAFLRVFLLDIKPPHFDEGINGWFVDQMTKNGFYKYDPTNYHGPLHFYDLFLSQTLFGRNLWALRLPVVLASIFCIRLTLNFEPFVGRNVSRWAALAMAVSPGFVFYGRYSIHEVWLVLFSMLFILGALGLWKLGTPKYLWFAVIGLVGMILTKETYIIHVGCAAIAGLVCYFSNLLSPTAEPQGGVSRSPFRGATPPVLQRFELPVVLHLLSALCLQSAMFLPSRWRNFLWPIGALGLACAFFVPMELAYGKSDARQVVRGISARWTMAFFFSICAQPALFLPWPWKAVLWLIALVGVLGAFLIPIDRIFVVRYTAIDVAKVAAAGGIAILFFYSGTFMNWKGVNGLYETFGAWFETGHKGNGHEKPWYYWLMLIGRYEIAVALGLVACLFCQMFKEISIRYLAIYGVGTLMAYSIVAYKTPWCIISIVWPLLFVFGAGLTLLARKSRRLSIGLGAALVAVALGLSIRLNYFHCTTDTEPYVYVQTYNDIFKLTDPLLKLARQKPTNYQLIGHMIRPSAYPLPWILGDFPKVGYYEKDALPTPLDGDFLVVQEEKIKTVEEKLQGSYYTMPFTIRPYQDTSKLYLSAKVFKDFFKGRVPDFVGRGADALQLEAVEPPQ